MLTATLTLGAATASSASAAPEWYAKARGVYSKVTSPVNVKGSFSTTVRDSNFYHVPVKLKCGGIMKGTIEAGGVGKVETYEATTCEVTEGSCHVLRAAGVNLPWKTELYSEGTHTRERIVSDGGGTPGWAFYCEYLATDTCNFNSSAGIANNDPGSVEAEFAPAITSCSVGGPEAGRLEGELTVEPAQEGVEWISAGEVKPTEWKQAGVSLAEPLGTKWTGHIELTDTGAGAAVECEDTAEGSVGSGAVGTMSKWTSSNCVTKEGSCPTPKMAAVKVPWRTELRLVAGVVRDVTTSEAGFDITCSGIISDTCTGAAGTLSAAMANFASGVEASLGGKELRCTLGGANTGLVTGTQLIEATKGGALEVT